MLTTTRDLRSGINILRPACCCERVWHGESSAALFICERQTPERHGLWKWFTVNTLSRGSSFITLWMWENKRAELNLGVWTYVNICVCVHVRTHPEGRLRRCIWGCGGRPGSSECESVWSARIPSPSELNQWNSPALPPCCLKHTHRQTPVINYFFTYLIHIV